MKELLLLLLFPDLLEKYQILQLVYIFCQKTSSFMEGICVCGCRYCLFYLARLCHLVNARASTCATKDQAPSQSTIGARQVIR